MYVDLSMILYLFGSLKGVDVLEGNAIEMQSQHSLSATGQIVPAKMSNIDSLM